MPYNPAPSTGIFTIAEPKHPTAAPEFFFLNEDEREFFEERAAIIEFDARKSRARAEELAYERVLERRVRLARAS